MVLDFCDTGLNDSSWQTIVLNQGGRATCTYSFFVAELWLSKSCWWSPLKDEKHSEHRNQPRPFLFVVFKAVSWFPSGSLCIWAVLEFLTVFLPHFLSAGITYSCAPWDWTRSVYVIVCVCAYVYMFVCVFVYVIVCVCVCMCVWLCVLCVLVSVCLYMCTCECTCACAHVCGGQRLMLAVFAPPSLYLLR